MKPHLPTCPQDILYSYQHHLRTVAGLSSKTCREHSREIQRFLKKVRIRQAGGLARLTPVGLTAYLTARSATCQPASLRQIAGVLRRFLRFAHQQGWASGLIALAVPAIADRTPRDLPAYLNAEQLELLLACWDRRTADGRRDQAIGLCLARLGLRAGEVARLRLGDLHWREGILQLQGSKNGESAQLPLLAEVGQSIAQYLHRGRPTCAWRQVFLLRKPLRPMSGQAVSGRITRALRACGISTPRPGAHLLRHTLASHLARNGASLKEVADVLRHRHLNSAAVYTHIDVAQLRSVAQPWPQEAGL